MMPKKTSVTALCSIAFAFCAACTAESDAGTSDNAGESTILDEVGLADYSIERQLMFIEQMGGETLTPEVREAWSACWSELSQVEKDEVLQENQTFEERRREFDNSRDVIDGNNVGGGELALPIMIKCAKPLTEEDWDRMRR